MGSVRRAWSQQPAPCSACVMEAIGSLVFYSSFKLKKALQSFSQTAFFLQSLQFRFQIFAIFQVIFQYMLHSFF